MPVNAYRVSEICANSTQSPSKERGYKVALARGIDPHVPATAGAHEDLDLLRLGIVPFSSAVKGLMMMTSKCRRFSSAPASAGSREHLRLIQTEAVTAVRFVPEYLLSSRI